MFLAKFPYDKLFILFISFFLIVKPIYSFPYVYFYSSLFALLLLAYYYRSSYFCILILLISIVFSGFRLNVGTDYISYTLLFESIYSSNDFNFTEPFTYIIVKFIKNLGLGNEFIFLLYAIIPILGLHRFLLLNDKFNSRLISYFIFFTFPIFYLSSFNQIRQWAAIGVSLYAIYYIATGNMLKFFTTILIASFMHLSAFILFIYIFINKRFHFYYVLVITLCSIIFSNLFFSFIEYTPYAIYIIDDGLRFEGGNYIALSFYLILSSLIVYKFKYFNRYYDVSVIKIILSNMNLLSIFTIIIGLFLNIDFLSMMRLNSFFIINLVISLPILIDDIISNKLKSVFFYILIIFGSSYCFYTLLINGEINHLTPFHFVFLPDKI